jgi:hypothetical protein
MATSSRPVIFSGVFDDALVGKSQAQELSPRAKPKNRAYVKLSAMPMTGRADCGD